jgi:ATP-dependent DNA helicase DinG
MTLSTASILGDDGAIARRLKSYESRPEQLAMAGAVESAIQNEEHVLVEAGTGVGKSFAYLVPAILTSTAERPEGEKKKSVIISTNTISLQEQLINRDIPFLNSVLPVEFSAVLAKGRSNYISLRRLKGALGRAESTLAGPDDVRQIRDVGQWAKNTSDGSRSDLSFRPSYEVWEEVQSDHGNCLGRKCPTYNDCHYYKARRRVWNADVVVVNHALFFSDLAIRREGASILPDYNVVIFDEAHTIADVAADHMGLSISNGQVDYMLRRLFSQRSNRGLLVRHELNDAQQLTVNVGLTAAEFFYEVAEWQRRFGKPNGRVAEPPQVMNALTPELNRLSAMLSRYAAGMKEDSDRMELQSVADRCTALASGVNSWMNHNHEDSVYWLERTGREKDRIKLCCSPIDVGPILRDELFNAVPSVVMTSATLAVQKQNFAFTKNRLGLTQTDEQQLGSPFDYRRQVKLFVPPANAPDPTDPKRYEDYVCKSIKEHAAATDGHAFVLFTSYSMLKNCARKLSSWMAEKNLNLLSQGAGLPRSLMLERFRNNPRAVLLGTDSFWQGVDVPGDALQTVIISKLPFSVPDHPLTEARVDRIREQGGNPFMDHQVPEAIIKLKQGFGRLIRTKSDTGRVVILDPRVRTKRYGRLFLDSLPECEVMPNET